MNRPNRKEIASLTASIRARQYPQGTMLASVCALRGIPTVTQSTASALASNGLVRDHAGQWIIA